MSAKDGLNSKLTRLIRKRNLLGVIFQVLAEFPYDSNELFLACVKALEKKGSRN